MVKRGPRMRPPASEGGTILLVSAAVPDLSGPFTSLYLSRDGADGPRRQVTAARPAMAMSGGDQNENAEFSSVRMRRAVACERARDSKAGGRAGAFEDACRRRVPLRPAHLGRLLRDRRR